MQSLHRDPSIDPGTSDAPELHTFQSSDRHTDVTPQQLSERWGISLSTATKTLKHTTQKFLRSAILPLSRRYRADRVFSRKTLTGHWSTDTMDGRCKSLDGNKYAQVFANKQYFSHIYPMDSKSKAGDALKLFCQEFGVPQHLTFDGSKEQTQKGTEFMSQVRKHGIDYHISEPNLHNQNPVEGCIRELRRKWYRIMVQKQVPEPFWDYGLRWVSDVSSLTYTTAGSGLTKGSIPLTNITGETPDISEYLDFAFYDKVFWMENWRCPGFRVSWIIAPSKIVSLLSSAGSFLDGGANHPLQRLAIPLMDLDFIRRDTWALQRHFKAKRDYLLKELQHMGIKIKWKPCATFYIWGDLSDLPPPLNDSLVFLEECVRSKVICVPGVFFDVNPGNIRINVRRSKCISNVRFSYGPGMNELQTGIQNIKMIIDRWSRHIDQDYLQKSALF